jgi:C_GCAxxG_C_C family probable redox protein
MTYAEFVADDYMGRHDLNCAETMLYSANEYYQLGLSDTALKAAAPFGGGMGREKACGAATGALMALGCLFARDRSHRDPQVREISEAFLTRFEQTFGSLDCAIIKQTHRSEERGCKPVVELAATLLEAVIDDKD